MPQRRYNGTLGATIGDGDDAKNWDPVSIVNGSYQWTVSASGTNEYYLEASGGGDPSIGGEPTDVQEGGTDLTEATVGSLAAGEWDWGDNDTLGFSTVYVRLNSATVDPDGNDEDFVTFTAPLRASDSVVIPAGAGRMDSGLDQNGVEIASFFMEDGYANNLLSGTEPLRIDVADAGEVRIGGSGQYRIDIGSSAVDVSVHGTKTNVSEGQHGLVLTGTGFGTITVWKGLVGIASDEGQVAEVDTVLVQYKNNRESDSFVTLGSGVVDKAGTGDPDVTQNGGQVVAHCDVDYLRVDNEGIYTQADGNTKQLVKLFNGIFYPDSDGTYTNGIEAGNGGRIFNTRDLRAKTIPVITLKPGASFKDPFAKVAWTTFTVDHCGLADLTELDLGKDFTLARTAL